MRIGKRIEKRSQVSERTDYLVVDIKPAIGYEQEDPKPILMSGSVLLSTYFNPKRNWGHDVETFIYEIDLKYKGKRERSVILWGLYEILKTFYKDLPSVSVLWGSEYNATECYNPDEKVDDNCIVVCDTSDPYYHDDQFFHIDGAFSISAYKKHLQYEWWPYPEKPIQGRQNILEHIIKHHLPDEYKQAAQGAFAKIKEQPKQRKNSGRNTTAKTSAKKREGKRNLTAKDEERLAEFARKLGFGKRIKKSSREGDAE